MIKGQFKLIKLTNSRQRIHSNRYFKPLQNQLNLPIRAQESEVINSGK